MSLPEKFCGYVGLIGRPNVGKSTLLNQLLEQKLSITSCKPQTTRHRILGIHTENHHQIVYVDTPGIHLNADKAMNRIMNKSADLTIKDVDVIVMLIDAIRQTAEDELVLEKVAKAGVPCLLVINKVDKVKDKNSLLPLIKKYQAKAKFDAIIPLSAKTGDNIAALEENVQSLLPAGPHLFYPDQLTDRPTKFVISEFIREKIFRFAGDELPYSVTVDIEKIESTSELSKISALILVDKESHKRMIIGKQGAKLKEIGSTARADIEKMLGKKVFLQLWVKVKQGWCDDVRVLKQLGYDD